MPSIMSDKLIYFILLFARSGALFILSPLFIKRGVPLPIRILLTLIFSLMLLPALQESTIQSSSLWFLVAKEIAIGYLLGTLFAFLLEAALLAGSWFATMAGFSASELVAPQEGPSTSLFAKLFALSVVALLLSVDFHHLFAYFLYDSFAFIPLGEFSLKSTTLFTLPESASFIFSKAYSFIYLPLYLLLILIIAMALLSRFYPEIPLFWFGFPLQIFVGIFSFSYLLLFFAPIVQKAFMEILRASTTIIFSL